MDLRDHSKLNKTNRLLLALLKSWADAGEYLPTNREMADRLGKSSVSVPSDGLLCLYELGFIDLESKAKARRVKIYETDQVIYSKHWYKCPPPERIQKWYNPKDSKTRRLQAEAAKQASEARAAWMARIGSDRTPCVRCQVRHDIHDEFGCNAYMAAVAA